MTIWIDQKNRVAIDSGNRINSMESAPSGSTQRGNSPGVKRTDGRLEINFSAVRSKAVSNLVALIRSQLKRGATRSEHHEKLIESIYRRRERDCVPVRREHPAVHRAIPMADLLEPGVQGRSDRSRL